MATSNMLPEGWEYDEEPAAAAIPEGWEVETPPASEAPTPSPTLAPDVGGSWRPGMERESAGGLVPAEVTKPWAPAVAEMSGKTTYDPKTNVPPGERTWGQALAGVAVPMGAAVAGTAGIMALAPSAPLWGAMALGSVGGDVIGRWLTNQPQSVRDEVFNGLTAALGGAGVAEKFIKGGMRLTGMQLSRVKQALGRIATAAGMGAGAMGAANELTDTPHTPGDYAVGMIGEGVGETIGMGLKTMMTPATTSRITEAAGRLGLGNDQIADIFTAPEGSAKRELLKWLSSTGAGATNAQLDDALRAVTRAVNTRFPQVPRVVGNAVLSDVRQGLENSIGGMQAARNILDPNTLTAQAVNTTLPGSANPTGDILGLKRQVRAGAAATSERLVDRVMGEAVPGIPSNPARGFSTPVVNAAESVRIKAGNQYGQAARDIDTALGGAPVSPVNFGNTALNQMDELVASLAPEHPLLARARRLSDQLTDPNRTMSAENMIETLKDMRELARGAGGKAKNYVNQLEGAIDADLRLAAQASPEAQASYDAWRQASRTYRDAIGAGKAVQQSVVGSRVDPAKLAAGVEKATSKMTPGTRAGMERMADIAGTNADLALPAALRKVGNLDALYAQAKGSSKAPSSPQLMRHIRSNPALENEMIRRFVSQASERHVTPGTGEVAQSLFGEGLRREMQNPANTSFLNNLSPRGRQVLADLIDNPATARPQRLQQAERAVGILRDSTDPYKTMADLARSDSGIPGAALTSTPALANPAGVGREAAQSLMVQGSLPNLRATGQVDVTELAEFTRPLREPSTNPKTPSAEQFNSLTTVQGLQDLRDFGDVGQALANVLEIMPAEYNATLMNRIRNLSSQVSTSNVMQSGIGIPTGIARTGGALMMVLGASQIPSMMRALITSNFAPATVQAAEAAGRAFMKSLQQRALQQKGAN